ncbi:FecR family protein [Sphingomonas sp. DT-204]|uniref:FecR family protein n=1 Tax=Sphingomonas sp. DT-204 TaxID=3396166 RepID=UPI003F1C08CC
MAEPRDRIDEEALAWAVRTADPAFDDWDSFTLWLEGDPARAARYDAIASRVAEAADDLLTVPVPEPVEAPARPQRRWLVGTGIAAALAGVVGYGAWTLQPQPYAIETAAGSTRTVTLGEGSTIALAGGTRLLLDRRDDRVARLERGQAMFVVRHDAAHPFRVKVGSDELVDVGTAFDVKRAAGVMRVAVSEGAVVFNPAREAVRVDPGKALVSDETAHRLRLSSIDPQAVGGWREGRLSYQGEPIGEVAADLTRALGVSIAAAPDVAERPFRGTLAVATLRKDPAAVAPLLGVAARRSGEGWVLTAGP